MPDILSSHPRKLTKSITMANEYLLDVALKPGLRQALVSTEHYFHILPYSFPTVGRGVLLDYFSWKQSSFDPFTAHPITASELLSCAEAQAVTFRTGDIVLIRTGWVSAYLSKNAKEKQSLADIEESKDHYYVGLEPSEEMLDFLHDNYFAAAVADSICFEVWPPKSFGKNM
jgi:hypothetical protein